jgi:hypothetical protein
MGVELPVTSVQSASVNCDVVRVDPLAGETLVGELKVVAIWACSGTMADPSISAPSIRSVILLFISSSDYWLIAGSDIPPPATRHLKLYTFTRKVR